MQINNWKRENFKSYEEQKYLTKFDDILNSVPTEEETVILAQAPEIKLLTETGLFSERPQSNSNKTTSNSKLWWKLKVRAFKIKQRSDSRILKREISNSSLQIRL